MVKEDHGSKEAAASLVFVESSLCLSPALKIHLIELFEVPKLQDMKKQH